MVEKDEEELRITCHRRHFVTIQTAKQHNLFWPNCWGNHTNFGKKVAAGKTA